MKKVLVLEDEASIRSFIVINLQRAGYEVVEAECGEEALQKLQENPDTKLCLLDIMLPDIDGFEVCRRIRMSNAQVGIIMLTARTQEIEYAIVKLFMENSGKALAREEILDAVWGKGYFGELKIVDVNVRRLRLKIEDDAQEPKYISTVWGFGYKWTV